MSYYNTLSVNANSAGWFKYVAYMTGVEVLKNGKFACIWIVVQNFVNVL